MTRSVKMDKTKMRNTKKLHFKLKKLTSRNRIVSRFALGASLAWMTVFVLEYIYPEWIYMSFFKSFFAAGAITLWACLLVWFPHMQEERDTHIDWDDLDNASLTATDVLNQNGTGIMLVSQDADNLYNEIIDQIRKVATTKTSMLLEGWTLKQERYGDKFLIEGSELMYSEIQSVVDKLLEQEFSLIGSDLKVTRTAGIESAFYYENVKISWGKEYDSGSIICRESNDLHQRVKNIHAKK